MATASQSKQLEKTPEPLRQKEKKVQSHRSKSRDSEMGEGQESHLFDREEDKSESIE